MVAGLLAGWAMVVCMYGLGSVAAMTRPAPVPQHDLASRAALPADNILADEPVMFGVSSSVKPGMRPLSATSTDGLEDVTAERQPVSGAPSTAAAQGGGGRDWQGVILPLNGDLVLTRRGEDGDEAAGRGHVSFDASYPMLRGLVMFPGDGGGSIYLSAARFHDGGTVLEAPRPMVPSICGTWRAVLLAEPPTSGLGAFLDELDQHCSRDAAGCFLAGARVTFECDPGA